MDRPTRDWREVARRARQFKFDRFNSNNASQPPNSDATASSVRQEPPVVPTTEAPPSPVHHKASSTEHEDKVPKAAAFSRHASMDFRTHKAAESGSSDYFTDSSKRASWTASRGNRTGAPHPPPPPPPPKPAHFESRQAPPASPPQAKREKMDQRFQDENAGTPVKTPSASASGGNSTPLQARTENVPAPASTIKKSNKLQTKPFAKLVKDHTVSYYDMLEITIEASEKDITKAFRSWAKSVHPDHNKEPTATEDFQALQHIYETLRVPRTRLAYNCRQKIRRCAFGNRARHAQPDAAEGGF